MKQRWVLDTNTENPDQTTTNFIIRLAVGAVKSEARSVDVPLKRKAQLFTVEYSSCCIRFSHAVETNVSFKEAQQSLHHQFKKYTMFRPHSKGKKKKKKKKKKRVGFL